MFVDHRVGQEEHSAFGVEYVHCRKCAEAFTDAYDVTCDGGDGCVVGVGAGDECVRVSAFHHHHAEIVASEHLFVCVLKGIAFAGEFGGQGFRILFPAGFLVRMARIDDFHSIEGEAEFFRPFFYEFRVAKQYGTADTFSAGLDRSLQHVVRIAFPEYHPHGLAAGDIGETAHQLVVVTHHFLQMLFVFFPVGNRLSCNSRRHCGLCHCRGYCRKEPGVQRLGQYVMAAVADAF